MVAGVGFLSYWNSQRVKIVGVGYLHQKMLLLNFKVSMDVVSMNGHVDEMSQSQIKQGIRDRLCTWFTNLPSTIWFFEDEGTQYLLLLGNF